ncbi:agmatinase [Candidatus Omnitrophota bacterium]
MKKLISFGDMGREFKDKDSSKITILPVPYDKTSTWIKGADKGPFAILEASQELELYDIETGFEVYRNGIHTLPALEVKDLDPEKMVELVQKNVLTSLGKDKFVVTVGGEHSVSIGAILAHDKKFKDISVLQLDAHADLREEYMGSRYNHACAMARIKDMSPAVQYGVRSMSIEEKQSDKSDNIFFAQKIVKDPGLSDKAIDKLNSNVYVTIDLDVFDPSIMPSTGTPQPGGLDWYGVTGLLKDLAEKKNVIGFDVVELCPNDTNKAPDILAAKLIYKFLSYIFKNK